MFKTVTQDKRVLSPSQYEFRGPGSGTVDRAALEATTNRSNGEKSHNKSKKNTNDMQEFISSRDQDEIRTR
ncbi:hypothetical protein TNCV_1672211 [Trichonephila clavipes]|nr:hypothetical protein TNCV_1672211 [Trichonephila clavipes]